MREAQLGLAIHSKHLFRTLHSQAFPHLIPKVLKADFVAEPSRAELSLARPSPNRSAARSRHPFETFILHVQTARYTHIVHFIDLGGLAQKYFKLVPKP